MVLLAAVCIPAFARDTGRDWIDKGNDLYAKGNYTESVKAYDKAVEAPDGWNATAAYLMKVDAFLKGATGNKSYIMTVQEFLNNSRNDTSWVIADVREPPDYIKGHIKGAANIPFTNLTANMKNIPEGKKVAVYCATNRRAQYGVMALRIFDDRDAWLLLDGVSAWKSAGQPIESGPT